jgi:hypothetical protein
MLQHVSSSSGGSLANRIAFNPLEGLLRRVRHQMVFLTAKDIYSLCTTANSGDPLGFFQDPEFMRSLHAMFTRSDQTVLSPFQVNVVADTLKRAGLRVVANDVVVPDHETASPETLCNALQMMLTNKRRDDRSITEICHMMAPLLPEFSSIHLALAARLLSMLQCTDKNFLGRLGRRAADIKDDLSPVDLSTIVASLCFSQVQPLVLFQLFKACEERISEFKADDVILILKGLNAAGPKFVATLAAFTEFAMDDIEALDAVVLSHFVNCFVTLEYSNRAHIEIVADAVADRLDQMPELQVVGAMQALVKLNVLQNVFSMFQERLLGLAPKMDCRNVCAVMDCCSQMQDDSALLMASLMDRAADNFMMFSSNDLGDIMEVLSTYPNAKGHRIVEAFGKHVRRRMDLLGPPPLAKCVHGLSMLGYADPQLYAEAAATHIRWGVKDYTILEPILHGLCISGPVSDPKIVTILATYVKPLSKRMTLHEVERANRYLTSLGCTDEWVFRALAERVRVFIKEVTPDVPEELQALLARAAANPAPQREEGGHRRRRHNNHQF